MARQMSVNSIMSISGCLETMGRRNKVGTSKIRHHISNVMVAVKWGVATSYVFKVESY
jgi:hypothetical protein